MENTLQSFDKSPKITAKSAIDLGIEESFDGFCDLSKISDELASRGITVRQMSGSGIVPSAIFDVETSLHKALKSFDIKVVDLARPYEIKLHAVSSTFEAEIALFFKERREDLTFVRMDVKARPKTLAARLSLQAVRLTKNRQRRRMTRALRQYCGQLEGRSDKNVNVTEPTELRA